MTKSAPIMVTVYNRVDHFKECIESLRKCIMADKSHLFIAIDSPYQEKDIDANKKIIQYSKQIKGFKELTLLIRKSNYGVNENIKQATREIFVNYDRVIRFEDDNIFSTDFLFFINKCLDLYDDRDDIFSVSGYQYPMEMPAGYAENIYIWQGYSAWGSGIWKKKFEKIDFKEESAINIVSEFTKDYKNMYKFNKISNHYIPILLSMKKRGIMLGDIYICLFLYLNKMYTVFPVISRVRNIGHDGSGLNCGDQKNSLYAYQKIFSGGCNYTIPNNIRPNNEINRSCYRYFKSDYKRNIRVLFDTITDSNFSDYVNKINNKSFK